jgi:glycine/D-amino acid oxidase-like deaminating enzyme/nitrite reductase/ring-hydroxylating ferredoxin subunit
MSDHRSVWLATATHPTFDPLTADLDVDVAVVGGGITGLTTALLLQRNGARVAVIEAGRVGGGTTGHTTGKVSSQHGLKYHQLIQDVGEDKARIYAEANQQAIAKVRELADDVGADCDFQTAPSFLFTTAPDEVEDLEAEHAAAVRLGLPASLTTETDLPFRVQQALRFDDQAHFHATRYTAALARALDERGVQIVEQTRAMGVEEGKDGVTVKTERGDVRAGHVVIATLLPFLDRGGFFAKARPKRAYGIAAVLRSGFLTGMHMTAGDPTRSTRPWVDGDRRGIIVVGEDHETGSDQASPARYGALEDWARSHFDVASFEYRWSAQDFIPADGMPYIGRSPRSTRTFVATGFQKWGLTNGTVAAQILTDLIGGRDHPWLEAFDATRIGDPSTLTSLAKDNLKVGAHFVGDRIGRVRAGSIDHLAPGEGGIVKADGKTVGAYRAPDGTVHAVSVDCTHMGCTVKWNSAERSWDCPCHGSRFDCDGAVLDGPAVRPLSQVEVEIDQT